MDDPTTPATAQQAADLAQLHAVSYRQTAQRQREQIDACLSLQPPDYSAAATACHRAHQYARMADACEELGRELADELFRLRRIRNLVREHPADAVPVIPLAELAAILGDGS